MPYNYAVIAQTGANVQTPGGAAAGTLNSINLASINDSGNVGFLGTLNTGFSGVVEGTPAAGASENLSLLSFGNRNFTFPQIANNNDVIAQDQYLNGSVLDTYIRVWTPDGSVVPNGSGLPHYAKGTFDGLSGGGDILVVPSISRNGLNVAFIDTQGSIVSLMEGPIGGTPSPIHTFPPHSGGMRPMIANNGGVVVRDGATSNSPIMLLQAGETPTTIASAENYSVLGASPGISEDGQIVAFYGALTSSGAATINTTQPLQPKLQPGPPGGHDPAGRQDPRYRGAPAADRLLHCLRRRKESRRVAREAVAICRLAGVTTAVPFTPHMDTTIEWDADDDGPIGTQSRQRRKSMTDTQTGEPTRAVRWQELTARQRTTLFVLYAAVYAGPSYFMAKPGEFEWYEWLGLYAPWLVVHLVVFTTVHRFQPRLTEFMPFLIPLLFASVGAPVAGIVLFGEDVESYFWGRVAVAISTALLAAWFTCGFYRRAGERASTDRLNAFRRRRLLASRWVKENPPEAAWNAHDDQQSPAFGANDRGTIELTFREIPNDPPGRRKRELRAEISFFDRPGEEASTSWSLPVTLVEFEDESHHLSIKDHVGSTHDVEYQFKQGKLLLKGA